MFAFDSLAELLACLLVPQVTNNVPGRAMAELICYESNLVVLKFLAFKSCFVDIGRHRFVLKETSSASALRL